EARPAAVALTLVEDTNGLEALFIRRAERADDPWSGQVALPGGHHEPGDRDLLATAIRETREETGVDLAAAERLGALDDLYPRTPTLPPVVVRPFVFALERRVVLVPSDEVQRAFWLPLHRLTDPAVREREVVALAHHTSGTAAVFHAPCRQGESACTQCYGTPPLRSRGLLKTTSRRSITSRARGASLPRATSRACSGWRRRR